MKNGKRVTAALMVAVALSVAACGPSIRDLAFERQAIWYERPGAPLKPIGDGVYYVTDTSGKVHQVIVEERKVVGDACADKCEGEKAKKPKKKAEATEGDAGY